MHKIHDLCKHTAHGPASPQGRNVVCAAQVECLLLRRRYFLPCIQWLNEFPYAIDVSDVQVACSLSSEDRHAVLHDFCMTIPYSILIVIAGLISIPFGAGWKGAILTSVGALELAVSTKSLSSFQAEKKSTPYTATSACELGLSSWKRGSHSSSSVSSTMTFVYPLFTKSTHHKTDIESEGIHISSMPR